ncbi:MAG: ZIP family metal transporter [Patescibacteria group bacterium]
MLWEIVGFSALGSVGGLVGGIFLALRKKAFSHSQTLLMISFAAGVMLATAFLDILPEAGIVNWWGVLLGVVFLFLLEKSLVWHHHHGDECESHVPTLITIGDSLHNFVDGVIIGGAFLASPATGIITSLAVMAHEIPHEMASFGLMLSLGWSRTKVIVSNLVSALVSVVGAVGVFYFREVPLELLLSFAGGMFIYLACSDLIPELHRSHKNNLAQILVFGLGIVFIYFMQKAL